MPRAAPPSVGTSVLRRGPLCLALVLGGILLGPTLLTGQTEDEEKVTLFTAVAEPGDEEKIPEKLRPYRDQIIRIAKCFRLAGTKQEKVKPGETRKFDLPEKLGEARISKEGKKLILEVVRDGKSLVKITVNRFPMILSDAKLKVGGQQVVIILDKGHK